MSDFWSQARYWIAVLVLVSMPPAIIFWYLIHPFAHFWRRVGPLVTYTIIGALFLALVGWLFQLREALLVVRYPFRWELAIPGILLYAMAIVIEIQCRRHLKLSILVGIPEVGADPGRLLTQGIYSRTRNPRYLGFLLGVGGWTLILNYRILYFEFLAFIPALYLVILLEERELKQRFGAEYERYLREVPRLIPWRG